MTRPVERSATRAIAQMRAAADGRLRRRLLRLRLTIVILLAAVVALAALAWPRDSGVEAGGGPVASASPVPEGRASTDAAPGGNAATVLLDRWTSWRTESGGAVFVAQVALQIALVADWERADVLLLYPAGGEIGDADLSVTLDGQPYRAVRTGLLDLRIGDTGLMFYTGLTCSYSPSGAACSGLPATRYVAATADQIVPVMIAAASRDAEGRLSVQAVAPVTPDIRVDPCQIVPCT